MHDYAPAPPGVDPARLARWMDAEGIGHGPLEDFRLIGGGTQNIVVAFRRDRTRYVLRRPPVAGRPDGSATMLREAAVLGALRGSGVPHPSLIATCPDDTVLGAAFYLMRPVAGVNPASSLPQRDERYHRELGFAMIDALVALRRVDVSAPPLRDLGSPDGWLERQTPRWLRRLARLEEQPGYTPLPAADVHAVAGWLDRHRPHGHTTGLVHGDFHFANVLVDEDEPRVAAVVDWELVSLGDPRLDAAHFVTTVQMSAGTLDLRGGPGTPAAGELIDRYLRATDDPRAEDVAWFRVLACLRLTALLEETVGRAAAGHASPALARSFRTVTQELLEQARHVMEESDVQL